MKKANIIIYLLIITIFIINFIIPTKIYACDSMISSADDFLTVGSNEAIDKDALNSVSSIIYNVTFAVAIGIALVIGTYLGIKIIVGTVEEKAKIKEMLVPYVVGVVVIFLAFTIWKLVVNIGTDIF